MLDIKLIREHPNLVLENLKKRNEQEKIELFKTLVAADKKWRELTAQINELRQSRNKISKEIAELKKQNKPVEAKMKEAAEIPAKIKDMEEEAGKFEARVRDALMRIPNMLHDSVPFGKDDSENVEVKKWGKKPVFDFTPKNHLEIAEGLDLIDAERAAKVAGYGFFYLKDDLVLLDLAIQKFAIDFLKKKGFTLIEPPLMIHRKPYEGVTDLADFESVMYKAENEDLYFIATSEHPMAAMFMDEVLDKKQLPIMLCGVSPCFRKEVGAHGKYTKGLYRMHQFNKVEQFVLCLPEQSWKMHEELQKNSEALYEALGIHYRVVNVCTGDIGIIAAKKYDTEFWMTDGKFREIGSNSNCTDYQARRLNIRFREKPGAAPEGFVHTLNNTAFATSRTMIAILEQFQQKNGSVLIPEPLRPYMDGMKKIVKRNP
jgi:seryl-tRNA synthetase